MSANPDDRPILVVEDNLEIREVLEAVLRSEGHQVLTAANGADALALLHGARRLPCLILLDLMMPVMDGYQFRDAQRRDARLAEIPVVLLTADGRAPEKGARLEVAGYLRKPVDLDTLVDAVARFC